VIDQGRRPQFFCPACDKTHSCALTAWIDLWDLHRRWLETEIPPRFRNRTFDNFRLTSSNKIPFSIVRRFVDLFAEHLREGTGLLLAGDMGTGKTHVASAALTEIVRAGHHAAFISAADYLAGLKPGHRGDHVDVEHLATVDLLVLDDVGSTRVTEWSVGVLSELLASRYDDRRPTILTTNSSDLAAHVGDRVVDRFDEMLLTARLVGASYRQRVPDDEDLQAAPWAIPEPAREFESRRCSAGRMVTKRFRMGMHRPEALP
jgi:DNA replication protein DnaC